MAFYNISETINDIGIGKETFPTIIAAFGALAVAVNVVDPVGQDEFGCKTIMGGRARFHKRGGLAGLPKIVPPGAYTVFPFKGIEINISDLGFSYWVNLSYSKTEVANAIINSEKISEEEFTAKHSEIVLTAKNFINS